MRRVLSGQDVGGSVRSTDATFPVHLHCHPHAWLSKTVHKHKEWPREDVNIHCALCCIKSSMEAPCCKNK